MKILRKLIPSSKLKREFYLNFNKLDKLQPISVKELSLIPQTKKVLNKLYDNKILFIERDRSKKLTLIVPYRKREEHLKVFIPYMKNYLDNQNINYEIIVAIQDDTNPFNKAKLMNIATLHSRSESDYFIFHDVDMLPQNADYSYINHTQRLLSNLNEEGVVSPYPHFGGVISTSKDTFVKVNGFSNNYWQWGYEDDDFRIRLLLKGELPMCTKESVVKTLPHKPSLERDTNGEYTKSESVIKANKLLLKENRKTFSDLKRGITNQDNEGLNSLSRYKINKILEEDCVKSIYIEFDK